MSLFRRNWPKTPEAAISKAAKAWQSHDDLLFGELMLLKSRAAMMRHRKEQQRWDVVEAAVTDVLVRLSTDDLRHASTREDRTELQKVLRLLANDREKIPSTAETETDVAHVVHEIVGGGAK